VPSVEVEKATRVTDELVLALARLLPQLSRSAPPPSADELAEIVASPATTLFVARRTQGSSGSTQGTDGAIVGALTLVVFRIPTAVRAWIEDVVVDASARGQGVGRALSQAALAEASRAGARTVELTSRPSREAANRMYLGLGFKRRETNVYRFEAPG